MAKVKDPMRQYQGAISKAKGKNFELYIDRSLDYYMYKGLAEIEKTPEPMRPVKSVGNGKFIAFFEKKAQPDYKGTIRGGKSIMFEAKFTSADRIEQDRVLQEQAEKLTKHQRLGALCFVIVGFDSGEVYRVPWNAWKNMKELYGRKYVTEAELENYRVEIAPNGILLLLDDTKGESKWKKENTR